MPTDPPTADPLPLTTIDLDRYRFSEIQAYATDPAFLADTEFTRMADLRDRRILRQRIVAHVLGQAADNLTRTVPVEVEVPKTWWWHLVATVAARVRWGWAGRKVRTRPVVRHVTITFPTVDIYPYQNFVAQPGNTLGPPVRIYQQPTISPADWPGPSTPAARSDREDAPAGSPLGWPGRLGPLGRIYQQPTISPASAAAKHSNTSPEHP